MAVDPASLDSFLTLGAALSELEVTIGSKARPFVARLRSQLAEAAARQQKGDVAGALRVLRAAMEGMAALAVELDPGEALLMRILSARFAQALSIGDKSTAKDAVNFMRHKAGDPEDEPDTDW